MLFKSKYIFETKKTRLKRLSFNLFFFGFIIMCFYVASGFYFVRNAENERELSEQKLFERHPDIIVVFTGQKGRIPYAFKKAKKYNQSNIFITGVHSRNTVTTLIKDLSLSNQINPDQLKIDYLARNTLENVITTTRLLRSSESQQRVLIVSHDYHITRIKTIFKHFKDQNLEHEFYFDGLKLDYSEYKNLKILYKEVLKYLRTWLFMQLWDV